MTIGTKSVLLGAHCFFLHPFFVAAAWWKLYGFPFDPRLWVAFFVHDIGYLGKPNMDGPEGERHPELGAKIIGLLFEGRRWNTPTGWNLHASSPWYYLCLYHSRHYAKQHGAKPSKLCFADKLAFNYQIKWLYLLMTGWTGELTEYLTNAKYWNQDRGIVTASEWYDALCTWILVWIEQHKDGAEDKVTVDRRISGKVY